MQCHAALVMRIAAASFFLLALPRVVAPAGGGVPASRGQDASSIAEAIATAKGSEAERARFHEAYFVRTNDAVVRRLEVVTQFRRAVLAAEARLRFKELVVPRDIEAEVRPFRGLSALRLHLVFSPHNVLVTMPSYDMVLLAPPGRAGAPDPQRPILPVDTIRTPLQISGQLAPPGSPMTAGLIEATFDLDAAGWRQPHIVGVLREGRYVLRVPLDLSEYR
jgi:hypothetical protein